MAIVLRLVPHSEQATKLLEVLSLTVLVDFYLKKRP